MNNDERAQAYSRLYALFAQLYRHGLTTELLPVLPTLPELAERLPAPFDENRAAAAHQNLFGFNIFPYESILLDATGMLGGVHSEAVAQHYQQVGYQSPGENEAPDHVSTELDLLAFLCGAESDAWEDGKAFSAQRMRQEQRRFLETHLLRWLPTCLIAIQLHDEPFFQVLADLTLQVVDDHYSTLIDSMLIDSTLIASQPATLEFALPTPPALASQAQTSLKDIADYLTTPPHSGIILTRHSITQVGRRRQLPRGFGSRAQMLTNLLRTAAQYEAIQPLFTALNDLTAVWVARYQALIAAMPALAPFVIPWRQQAQQTQALLTQLQQDALTYVDTTS
ncbi:MAG: molecular chaperone TorD family protein [Caldilineaceae bacterium]